MRHSVVHVACGRCRRAQLDLRSFSSRAPQLARECDRVELRAQKLYLALFRDGAWRLVSVANVVSDPIQHNTLSPYY